MRTVGDMPYVLETLLAELSIRVVEGKPRGWCCCGRRASWDEVETGEGVGMQREDAMTGRQSRILPCRRPMKRVSPPRSSDSNWRKWER